MTLRFADGVSVMDLGVLLVYAELNREAPLQASRPYQLTRLKVDRNLPERLRYCLRDRSLNVWRLLYKTVEGWQVLRLKKKGGGG